jgi:hypothetical protein
LSCAYTENESKNNRMTFFIVVLIFCKVIKNFDKKTLTLQTGFLLILKNYFFFCAAF